MNKTFLVLILIGLAVTVFVVIARTPRWWGAWQSIQNRFSRSPSAALRVAQNDKSSKLEFMTDQPTDKLTSPDILGSTSGQLVTPSAEPTLNPGPTIAVPTISDTKQVSVAILHTTEGDITIKFNTGTTPNTIANFIKLSRDNFYNGTIFHRVIKGFMIQGGDPKGDGTGGSGKNIKLEINKDLKHVLGAVAMARSSDPDSASSQFYITLAETPNLDGQYAVFGKVIEGIDVVLLLRQEDVMKEVNIEKQ